MDFLKIEELLSLECSLFFVFNGRSAELSRGTSGSILFEFIFIFIFSPFEAFAGLQGTLDGHLLGDFREIWRQMRQNLFFRFFSSQLSDDLFRSKVVSSDGVLLQPLETDESLGTLEASKRREAFEEQQIDARVSGPDVSLKLARGRHFRSLVADAALEVEFFDKRFEDLLLEGRVRLFPVVGQHVHIAAESWALRASYRADQKVIGETVKLEVGLGVEGLFTDAASSLETFSCELVVFFVMCSHLGDVRNRKGVWVGADEASERVGIVVHPRPVVLQLPAVLELNVGAVAPLNDFIAVRLFLPEFSPELVFLLIRHSAKLLV